MRQCPTLASDERPLIAHSIASEVCMKRQREFYHKCHRCLFRGKSADFSLPAEAARNGLAAPAGFRASGESGQESSEEASQQAS